MKRRRFVQMAAAALCGCMIGTTILAAAGPIEAKATEISGTEWDRIQSIVSRYYGEWNDGSFPGAVSDFTPDTALMGNGDIGVNSGGTSSEKTFYISKGDFLDYNDYTTSIAAGGYTIKRSGSVNLAPSYKAVSASTDQNWGNPNFGKETAVSGELKQIGDGYGWVSEDMGGNKDPQWLELEFEEDISVQKYELYNDGAVRASGAENNTRDFELQYSSNGEDWETADAVTGNAEDIYAKVLDSSVTAKHFRIYITDPVQPSVTANIRARIGQLKLYSTDEATPDIYEKEDILNAEVLTDFTEGDNKLSMRTFTSADKNIVVTEMSSQNDSPMQLSVETWAKADNEKYPVTAEVNGDNSVTVTRTSHTAPGSTGKYTSRIALTSSIIGSDYTSEVQENSKGVMSFTLEPDHNVYVVTAVGGGGKTYDTNGDLQQEEPADQSKALLDTVKSETDVANLLNDHKAWWKDFWSASFIDFGTGDANLDLMQRYYYGAQYILGCTSREGKHAPGIMGVWTTTDKPMWENHYQLNYNYNATFYGTSSSNRPELGLPGFEEMLLFMPEGMRRSGSIDELRRIDAQYVNERIEKGTLTNEGIPGGLLYPCALSPGGVLCYDSYQKEPMYAAYSAYPGTQYYQFTKDNTYLEEKLYDYLKACAVFYETWLEKDENGQYNIYAAHNEESWSYNAAVELGAAYSLFSNLVDASITLNKDENKRELWTDIRDHLAPQPTAMYNGKMVYTLAEKTRINGQYVDLPNPVPGDGNALPLELLQQGERLGYYSTPEELQIVANTIETFGSGVWSQRNNFPRIYTMAVRSRYPAATIVPEFAKVISDSIQPNLRIKDPSHGVEKVGATEAVNNMLMLTDQGITKVFPNWLPDKNASFARLRAKGAFLISSEYDAALRAAKYVEIESEKGGEFTLASPWMSQVTVTDSNGNEVQYEEGSAPNWSNEKTITFDTNAGETYTVSAKEGIPENVYLSADRLDMKAGTAGQLEAFATNGSAISFWESDNTDVAAVSENGMVTAVSKGTANIKAGISKTAYASCRVTVSANEVTLLTGTKQDLNEFAPEAEKIEEWKSSDTKAAFISEDGIIQARGEGKADISVKADGITYGLSSVTVNKNTLEINKGRSASLASMAEQLENITSWSSSDSEIAVVGKDGTIQALNEGEADIKVIADNVEIELCKVKVDPLNQGGNVATGGRAFASDNAGGFTPDRAICGGEIAQNYEGWVTNPMAYEDARWLAVELQGAYTIDRWVVTHDGHRDDPIFNTKDFTLQYSDNGETWEDADVVTGNTEDKTDRTLAEPVTAKYFRIYITAPEQEKKGSSRGRIRQVELYAQPDQLKEISISEIEAFEQAEAEAGTAFDDLKLPGYASTLLSNNNYANIPVVWEKSNYDKDLVKVQTIKGTLQLPKGISSSVGEAVEIKVNVVTGKEELNYEAIDKAIAEAEAIKQDGYTQESYQALQDALKNAKDARRNATTQEELTQKKDDLRAAIDGLRGSKNVLEVFLSRAKQHVENGDTDGLVESVQKLFAEAIAEGEAVMENKNATKDEVLKVSLKLMKAIQALDMKAGDKADLGMALELTAMIDLTQYVDAGQAEYLAAKATAEEVMGNGDAMQPEVDAAWETLVDTMMNLRLKADKSTLADLLESVKDLDLNKYTDETAAVYRQALAAANAVMENEQLSVDQQSEVDNAVKNLKVAKANLKEKEGSKDDNNGGNNNNGNSNGGNNGGNNNGGNGSQKGNSSIKTGDTVPLFIPALGILISMGAAVVIGVAAYKTKRR